MVSVVSFHCFFSALWHGLHELALYERDALPFGLSCVIMFGRFAVMASRVGMMF